MGDQINVSWPGWETVRLIGRGSFGAVYEIQRDVLGDVEKAAMKVITIPQNAGDIEALLDEGFDDESVTSTFKSHLKNIVAEYSLMKKMVDCPNIVNCDDIRYVQHDDGIGWDIFIKMELLTPLTKALPEEIPEEVVMKIAKDMCNALVMCKEFDVVHRDIKPQNIFLSKRGDYKLGDFGIAKTVEKTVGGTKIGTYKYMAPEVYNNQPYGTGADIYSLGLVLYWLLNERRMPFMPLPPEKVTIGMDEAARQRRLSGEALPAPAHGSEELKRIVLKACAYDPKERYASAAQMLRALTELDTSASIPVDEYDFEEEGTVGPDFTPASSKNVMDGEKTVGPIFETGPKQQNEAQTKEQLCKDDEVKKKLSEDKGKNNKIHLAIIAVVCTVLALVVYFATRSKPETQSVQASVGCSHNWRAATCTTPKTCKDCGATEGGTTPHNWMEATCTHPKVCTVCFQEVGQTAAHKWPSNDHSKPMYCTVCGASNGVEEKPVQPEKKPSVEDVKPFGDVITYPSSSAYLDTYEIKYVKAPGGNSIYVFWNYNGGVSDSKRRFVLYEGDKVTVLARQGTRSCVIFTDKSGNRQIGWVNSDYLVSEY